MPEARFQPLAGAIGEVLLVRMRGYAPALAALAIAMAVHYVSTLVLGDTFWPLVIFGYLAALVFAAWCGYGPGLLTAVLLVTAIPYALVPRFSLARINLSRLAILVLTSLLVSGLSAHRRRTEGLLRNINVDLEKRVAQQTAELQHQLAELEALYSQLSVGLCFMDRDLRYVRVNAKLAAINGANVAEHIGRRLQDVLPAPLANQVEPLHRRVLDSGEPLLDYEIHGPLPTNPRDQRDWLISCTPVKTDAGSVLGLQVIVQDITERKSIEDALQSTNEALRRANDNLGQFAYVAAHDLQEPLRTIIAFSEIVQRDWKDRLDARAAEHLGYIAAAGKRLSRLIADVLAYSRVASDDNRALRPVSLDEVLDSALANLNTPIAETQASIVRAPLPVVDGDPDRLQQVFQNLIGNALKYRRSDVAPRIEIRADPQNGAWIFSVGDNGQGFRQEYADRIFGIFRRLHGQNVPGSGIGLAICKTVVERHGGKVWAESELGRGATFYFTLPAAKEVASEHDYAHGAHPGD